MSAVAVRLGETPTAGQTATYVAYDPVENLVIENNSLLDVAVGVDLEFVVNGAYGSPTSVRPRDVLMRRNLIVWRSAMRRGWELIEGATSTGNYASSDLETRSVGDRLGPARDVVSSRYGSTLTPRW